VALREALAANDAAGPAHAMLGDILRAEGLPGEAADHYERALRLSPSDAALRDRLALSLVALGHIGEAVAQLRQAIDLAPGLAAAKEHLALLLATNPKLRDPGEAVRLARSAERLTDGKAPDALEVLAAAYAAAGDFDDAVEVERRAVELLQSSGNGEMARAAMADLERYRRRIPLTPVDEGAATVR
jgi:spermidine synthase